MVLIRLLVLVGCLSSIACSGAEEPSIPASFDRTASAQELLGSCSGAYSCVDAMGTRFATSLQRDGDRCFAGKVVLEDDGAARVEGEAWRWSTSDVGFDLCADGNACIRCTAATPARAGTKQEETEPVCGGYASSCEGRAEGTCTSQRGCIAGSHLRWDGSPEFECKGSPSSCGSFGSAESCGAQTGCAWE
jgi:hypothetical protein